MLTIKEQQEILLDIMKQFHDYCEENHLRYCLAAGTLLGAIRHKGFIPWDNDVDIYMPRPDYEKFFQLAQEKPIADHLRITNYRMDPTNHYVVIRIYDIRTKIFMHYLREQPEKMGIFVDIFAMDGVGEDRQKDWLNRFRLRFNQRLQSVDLYGQKERKGLKQKLKYLTHYIFPNKGNVHEYKIDQLAQKYDYDHHEKVLDISDYLHFNTYLTHDDFDHPILTDFEQYQFYIPQRYHEYLTDGYGDYMTPPPENEREIHGFDAEWIG